MIDIPTEHLRLKIRPTRLGGDDPSYFREFSSIDGHRFSFFPDSVNIWSHLPRSVRTFEDMDSYSTQIQHLKLTAIRHLKFLSQLTNFWHYSKFTNANQQAKALVGLQDVWDNSKLIYILKTESISSR